MQNEAKQILTAQKTIKIVVRGWVRSVLRFRCLGSSVNKPLVPSPCLKRLKINLSRFLLLSLLLISVSLNLLIFGARPLEVRETLTHFHRKIRLPVLVSRLD